MRRAPDNLHGAAENKLAQAMLSDLKTNVFPDQTIKYHHTDLKTGERKVVEV